MGRLDQLTSTLLSPATCVATLSLPCGAPPPLRELCPGLSRWNQLDLAIVLLSIMGITLEEIEVNASLPINPTIIRIMRVLRIARGEYLTACPPHPPSRVSGPGVSSVAAQGLGGCGFPWVILPPSAKGEG